MIIFYEFEDFQLDVENEKLLKNNEPVVLTQKAFSILHLLIKNADQLVKKETLISEIWHDNFVEEANITQQIYLLRKMLGNDSCGNSLIKTIPKRGYSFTGEIRAVSKSEGVRLSKNSETNLVDKIIPPLPKEENRINPNKIILSIAAALSVLIILISVYIFVGKNSDTDQINSIAVLPFRDINSENDDSKLGFGISDAVITNLSKQQKIPVRSMSAVFQYAAKDTYDPVEAGKTLGVDSILEGTVQRDDEKVRVSLRLLKISDGSTLWAETFNEKFSNIFALQDSISVKVASSILPNLSVQEKQIVAQKPANSKLSVLPTRRLFCQCPQ